MYVVVVVALVLWLNLIRPAQTFATSDYITHKPPALNDIVLELVKPFGLDNNNMHTITLIN